jgi:hypothetical protein
MDARRKTRIAQTSLAVGALAFGTVTATALARQGADDGAPGTTATTPTATAPTPTRTTPAPKPGTRVSLNGTVVSVDAAAGTFALRVHGHHNRHRGHDGHRGGRDDSRAATVARSSRSRTTTFTVHAAALPRVGRKVLVKGTWLADGTVRATRVQVLRGDDRRHHNEPGDDHGRHSEPGDDHGRHSEPGDDRGRGHAEDD